MLKKFLIAGLLGVILWGGFFAKSAFSQAANFRFYNLESDIRRIELRLNQLELSLAQNRQPANPNFNLTPRQSRGNRRNLSQSEREQMFDRLSTLVVELKQEVNLLNKRVSKLESR